MKTGVFIFKKIISALLFALTLIIMFVSFRTSIFSELDVKGKVEEYSKSYSSNAKITFLNKGERSFNFEYTGESAVVENLHIKKLIDVYDFEVVKTENLEEGISIYFFSKKIPISKIIDGKRINLHIYYGNERIKIGSPLIYGGF